MLDLTGKVAIVTGSTRGIGKAIAIAYAEAGASVVISSRKADACKAVAWELSERGHQAFAIPCHVGKKDEVANLVSRTYERFGPADILVCNAAANPTYGPLADLSDEVFDKIMETNVKSPFWLCNLVAPMMAEGGGGSIILISSVAALRGSTTIGCYGMSKAAEAAMTRNLALEWGPRSVRVNAIAPGLIATDFAKALLEDPERKARIEARTPLRRVGQPEEIAGVALFLASNLSSYMTGQILVVDGGDISS